MSKVRGGRRAMTFTAASVKKKFTAAEKALRLRSRSYSISGKGAEKEKFLGAHRKITQDKDKKVRAFLEYKEQAIEKNLHLVDKIMVPVVEQAKALDDVSPVVVNNFIKRINSYRTRIASAQSMEEIDKIIKEKEHFEAENAIYQKAKAVAESIDKAADVYRQEAEKFIAKRRVKLTKKLQKKIEHLETLLEAKKASPVSDEKETQKIKDRINFLTYLLEDKLKTDKEKSLKSIESQIKHLGHQIQAIEERLKNPDQKMGVNKKRSEDSDKKKLGSLNQTKNELEEKQKEFSEKLHYYSLGGKEKTEKLKAETIKKTDEFQLFHSNLPDISEGIAAELKGSPYLNARSLISSINSIRFFDLDVKNRQLELNKIEQSVIEEKREKQDAEKQFSAEVEADVDKIMADIYDNEPVKEPAQTSNEDIDSLVDKLFDSYTPEKAVSPQSAMDYQSDSKKNATRRPSVLTMEYSSPFGKEWHRKSGKIGGANSAGNVGGVYAKSEEGKTVLALYKQDIKKGKVRVAKLIGEGLAGSLINKAAKDIMGDDYQARLAQTELVKVRGQEGDKSGNAVYIKSTFIDGYQDDFWKVAYQARYADYYENKLANTPEFESFERRIVDYKGKQSAALKAEMDQLLREKSNFEADLQNAEGANAKENIKIQIENIDMKVAQLNKKMSKLQVDFDAAKKVLDRLRSDERVVNKHPLIDFLVERKMSVMQRPSGVTSLSSRKVVSEAILSPSNNMGSKQFLKDFTGPTALRLWLADFGVHNANKGVAMINHEYRIVDIDFGAAFSGLKPEVNPFSRTKTGIEVHKFYKNHFLEYDDAIIKSPEMAKAFIKVGEFKPEDIRQWVGSAIAETVGDNFDKKALLKFAKRLGMKTKELSSLKKKDETEIVAYIKDFMGARLEARSKSLLRQGMGLLLENCYDKENKMVNEDALKKVIAEYPQIVEFAQQEFRKMNLVLHNSNVPGKDQLLKDMLLYHINRLSTNQKYYAKPVLQEPAAQPVRLDPLSEASLLEVKRLLDYENQLINQYKKMEAPDYMFLQKLRISHQGAIDTFTTYAELDMLPGNQGLQLRDQLIKNDIELHGLNVIGSSMASNLTQVLPGQIRDASPPPVAPKVQEEAAPKMRRATTIVAQHTANAMRKKLIRRSDPINDYKDPRKLSPVDNNKSTFFYRKTTVASDDNFGPKTSPSNRGKKK